MQPSSIFDLDIVPAKLKNPKKKRSSLHGSDSFQIHSDPHPIFHWSEGGEREISTKESSVALCAEVAKTSEVQGTTSAARDSERLEEEDVSGSRGSVQGERGLPIRRWRGMLHGWQCGIFKSRGVHFATRVRLCEHSFWLERI